MCDKCERTVELLKQTEDGKFVVEFAFPQGEPKLKKRPEPAVDQTPDDWIDPCPVHLFGRCDCY